MDSQEDNVNESKTKHENDEESKSISNEERERTQEKAFGKDVEEKDGKGAKESAVEQEANKGEEIPKPEISSPAIESKGQEVKTAQETKAPGSETETSRSSNSKFNYLSVGTDRKPMSKEPDKSRGNGIENETIQSRSLPKFANAVSISNAQGHLPLQVKVQALVCVKWLEAME